MTVAAVSDTEVKIDESGNAYRAPKPGFASKGLNGLTDWLDKAIYDHEFKYVLVDAEDNLVKKDNPITVTIRTSMVGMGLVAVFRNHGQDALRNVSITTISHLNVRKKVFFEPYWHPDKIIELGWLERCMIENDGQIAVNIEGYEEAVFNIWQNRAYSKTKRKLTNQDSGNGSA
jgi:hypothetical protein